MTIQKGEKVYQVTETEKGWLLKDTSEDDAPVLKVSKGFCRDIDDLKVYIASSTLY